MKKITTILSLLFLTSVLFSCKKDYNCECTFVNGISTQTITIENHTKEEAEDLCNQSGETYKPMKGTCVIK